MSEARRCTQCGELKAETDFYTRRAGLMTECKVCNRRRAREYGLSHREEQQAYRESNAERRHATRAAWYAKNKEAERASGSAWRAANPDSVRASHQRWLAANRERVNISNRARDMVSRAIKRGDLIRPSACEQCGVEGKRIEGAHADYSKPLEVRWLCKPCHARWDHDDPKTKGVHIPLNHAIGTRVSTAKLTEADVRLIREAYASGQTSGVKLAAEFGVRPGAVYQILRGRTWTHVS